MSKKEGALTRALLFFKGEKMNVKNVLSKHAPSILSGTACVGVIGTGYFSTKLGMIIEAEKDNLKSEDKEVKKAAIKRIALKGLPSVGVALLSIVCIILSRHLSKKELAEVMAALAVQTKLFNQYRSHLEPEKDKEIMKSITLEKVKENDECDVEPGLMRCTDPYIAELSGGEITSYLATEADVFCAANYLINRFSNDGYDNSGSI